MRAEEGKREQGRFSAGRKRQVGLYVARYVLKTLEKTIIYADKNPYSPQISWLHWYINTAARYLYQQSTISYNKSEKCNAK